MKRDIIIFGAFAGVIGDLVKLTIALILYYFGLIKKTYIHIANGYFGSESLDDIFSILNSIFSDFFYAAFLGVLLYLALRFTDMKYAKLKGVLFGGLVHVFNNGVLIFGNLNKASIDSQTYLLLIIPTILFGFSTAWVLEKLER